MICSAFSALRSTRYASVNCAISALDNSFAPASIGMTSSSEAFCSRRSLPPRTNCIDCTMNSISRMPPMSKLEILLEIAPRHFASDQRLHFAQRLEHTEIQIAPIDERPHEFLVCRAIGVGADDRRAL